MLDWVVPLEILDPNALSLGGGKAVNVARMIQAGLPVPPGYCITTAAYTTAMDDALDDLIQQLDSADPTDVDGLSSVAASLRERVLARTLPSALRLELESALEALGSPPLAVRSSATAEDLPGASFAGQQDTFLNVIGLNAVLQAVRRCWASLWTDRAVIYRARNRVSPHGVHLAVIVQRLVDAEVAGVLFTANPLSGRRDQAVVDASAGLGEAVVSGAVTPDHFVIDTSTGNVVERSLGSKRLQIIPQPGGGTRRLERDDQQSVACISDQRLAELARLGAKVEALFGAPQDCEFALTPDGSIWLTQARPITTLFPLPRTAPPNSRALRVYFNINVLQGFFRPFTPMGLQSFRLVGAALTQFVTGVPQNAEKGPTFLTDAGGRLFVDITTPIRLHDTRRLLSFALDNMESRSARIARELFDDPRLSVRRTSRWRLLPAVAGLAVRSRILPRMLRTILWPERARAEVWRMRDHIIAASDPAGLDPAGRVDLAERLLMELPPRILPRVAPLLLVGLGSLALARRLARNVVEPAVWDALRRSLPHNPTTQMDLELADFARSLRLDSASVAALRAQTPVTLARAYRYGQLPSMLQTGLARFLQRYGHRAVGEIDIGLPRWSEDPAHLIQNLVNYLGHPPDEQGAREQFQAGLTAAERARSTIVRRAARRNPLLGWLVSFLLSRGRALAGERETPKFLVVLILARTRALLAPVGDVLVASNRLATADDVWFLDFAEIRAALRGRDSRPLVAERRASYDFELARRHLPRLLLSDGTEPTPRFAAEGQAAALELRGTPASAGTAEGTARVILDPVGAHIQSGEILVAPSTDPGWTPLFLTAAGLVMEMGGSMSHGAVVAREYGIPAVVGVPDATERITTGVQISVDGSAGVVRIRPNDKDMPAP